MLLTFRKDLSSQEINSEDDSRRPEILLIGRLSGCRVQICAIPFLAIRPSLNH